MADVPNILDTSDWKVYCTQTEDGEHWVKVVASNGRTIVSGETYKNLAHAEEIAYTFAEQLGCAYVYKGTAKKRTRSKKVAP